MGGRRGGVEVVGVMKDRELKLEETQASHTRGGAGECRVQGGGKWRTHATLLPDILVCQRHRAERVPCQRPMNPSNRVPIALTERKAVG